MKTGNLKDKMSMKDLSDPIKMNYNTSKLTRIIHDTSITVGLEYTSVNLI